MKIATRNFMIFVTALVLFVASLAATVLMGDNDLDENVEWVSHTHSVISRAQAVSMLVEAMTSSQRAYMMTSKDKFLNEYKQHKSDVSDNIAELADMTNDNPSQRSRLAEFRAYFVDFTNLLEGHTEKFRRDSVQYFADVESVDSLKENLLRVNDGILKEEYEILNERVAGLVDRKNFYLIVLMIGFGIGAALLVLFNVFLLNAQRKRLAAEGNLQSAQDRFALAIEGTQDGIYDWDIKSNKIFYSKRLFAMLGYDRAGTLSTPEEITALMHPDDRDRVWDHVRRYLDGDMSEYMQEYRLRHKSGRWVWIQSRGKALFDKNGKAYRMVGAHSDISTQKMQQHQLESDKKKAEEANQAKSEFLAHMSHEIRTPLTAITGIAEIFQRSNDNLNDKQKQLVKVLNTSSATLKDLINDVLDFSKIESGELELSLTPFNVDKLFESVNSMMALRANEKGISYIFDYTKTKGIEFVGDQLRIRQILINLIGNAIKFTEKGGVKVESNIQHRSDVSYIAIEVTDTGIGIGPEVFELIFERFKQGDSSVSRKYGGTGLGLPISRNLARLMGGDILISSELGRGSTFTILLPMAEGVLSRARRSALSVKKESEKNHADLHEEKRALLVEDYEGNIVIISYILDEMKLAFDIARTGTQALEMWQQNHYDIVLMDVQMPEMDGFTATQEIRTLEAQRELPPTPIIGMTAHALVGDKDRCLEAGMDAYLPKPIDEQELKSTILRYLAEHEEVAA